MAENIAAAARFIEQGRKKLGNSFPKKFQFVCVLLVNQINIILH